MITIPTIYYIMGITGLELMTVQKLNIKKACSQIEHKIPDFAIAFAINTIDTPVNFRISHVPNSLVRRVIV